MSELNIQYLLPSTGNMFILFVFRVGKIWTGEMYSLYHFNFLYASQGLGIKKLTTY